jgi:hypothetical protein
METYKHEMYLIRFDPIGVRSIYVAVSYCTYVCRREATAGKIRDNVALVWVVAGLYSTCRLCLRTGRESDCGCFVLYA